MHQEDSRFDYQAAGKRKTHDRRHVAVRTLEFVAEDQEILNIDLRKSLCAIASEKGVYEKLIRLVVNEEIRFHTK